MDLVYLAQQSSELIEHIAERHGEDAKIRTVMLLVEVDTEKKASEFISTCSDQRPWIQIAYIQEHLVLIEKRRDEIEASESD